MKKLFATIAVFSTLLLTACGFAPVYGTGGGASPAQEQLAQIHIENIPNREGQYLRNALIDRFYRHGRPQDPAYILDISRIAESRTDLDITKSSDSTRGQLRISAAINLKRKGETEPVLNRSLRAVTSYNILGSEFATNITEQDARENALDGLAQQIETQLALYFNR